jgi:hypothetical protein
MEPGDGGWNQPARAPVPTEGAGRPRPVCGTSWWHPPRVLPFPALLQTSEAAQRLSPAGRRRRRAGPRPRPYLPLVAEGGSTSSMNQTVLPSPSRSVPHRLAMASTRAKPRPVVASVGVMQAWGMREFQSLTSAHT